jgi:hypothetical protein
MSSVLHNTPSHDIVHVLVTDFIRTFLSKGRICGYVAIAIAQVQCTVL